MQIVEEKYNWARSFGTRSGTKYIVLHHAEAVKCTAQDVHRWHLNNGWAGIGYHYFVAKDGTIYRGRQREAIGAQCEGWNTWSIGICAEGNYHPDDEKPFDTEMPPAQENALIELCCELLSIYPAARVVGHEDLVATACPGDYFPLEEIEGATLSGEIIKEVFGIFPDIKDHWSKPFIDAVSQVVEIKGKEDGLFHPDDGLTRGESMVIAYRILKTVKDAGVPINLLEVG